MDERTLFWQKLFAKAAASELEHEQNIYTPHGWKVRTREFSLLLGRLLSEGRLRPGQVSADLGCGSGWYSRKLAEAGIGTVSLDLSAEMLCAAREKDASGKLSLCQGDCCKVPFQDLAFDLILSVGSVCIVEDPKAFFAEMARVLKPGGTLIVVALNRSYAGRLLREAFRKPRMASSIATRGYTPFELSDELVRVFACGTTEIIPLYILPLWLRPFGPLLQRIPFLRLACWRLASAFMIVTSKQKA